LLEALVSSWHIDSMLNFCLILILLLGPIIATCAADVSHTFKKVQLSDKFWAEGATFGDFNHDGTMDIVAGPYWYEGPDFQKRHEFYGATVTFARKKPDGTEEKIEGFEGALGTENKYSDNFFAYAYDFNKDGWDDILIIGFPGEQSAWYENPRGQEVHWKKYVALDVTDNESPTFTDITGDGKPEIVCASKGCYGYAEPDWNDPAKPWKFHAISPNNKYQRFTHGMGVGDVNGDGRQDLLETSRLQQPALHVFLLRRCPACASARYDPRIRSRPGGPWSSGCSTGSALPSRSSASSPCRMLRRSRCR